MKLISRLYELELVDTDITLLLHNPSIEDFDDYFKCMRDFSLVSRAFAEMGKGEKVKPSEATELPTSSSENMQAIVLMVADLVDENGVRRPITSDEVKQLSSWDCLCVIRATEQIATRAMQANPTMPVNKKK